jgi:hypothetical protein
VSVNPSDCALCKHQHAQLDQGHKQLLAEIRTLEKSTEQNGTKIEAHLAEFTKHAANDSKVFRQLFDKFQELTKALEGIKIELVTMPERVKNEIEAKQDRNFQAINDRIAGTVSKYEVRLVWFVITTVAAAAIWVMSNVVMTRDTADSIKPILQSNSEMLKELRELKVK